jgi:hypothetical protein
VTGPMECESCAYRDKENPEICKEICGYYPPHHLGKIDISELATKLRDKETEEAIEARKRRIPQLSDCPNCERHSLFFDSVHYQFECLNTECVLFGNPILRMSDLFDQILVKILRASSPKQ